jgi:hypothetical protein
MAGFQSAVAVQPVMAVPGDFASHNPRWNVLAGPGGLVCGSAGVTVGRFAWLNDSSLDANDAPSIVNNFPGSQGPNPGAVGAPAGFVHREQQALITQYLSEGSLLIPAGFPITLFNGGDFWVKNDGAALAQAGMKAYASLYDGKVSFAATASASTGASATGSIAASTFSVTASIADNLMTVTAVGSGTIVAGATLTALAAAGTKVVAQKSGTAGGIGVYEVDIPEQTVASGTITGTYGTFTAASGLTGAFTNGGILTGTGISATTRITQQLTGPAGGLGTYAVDVNTVVSSTTISESGNVETKFVCMSPGLPGELCKMSTNILG